MISVIIPTLNEALALPTTLQYLHGLPGDFEVILVDGGSDDETQTIARSWGNLRVLVTKAGRARQMNKGAQQASGEILLFLHADTLLPPSAIVNLNARETDYRLQWGGFHHQFSGNTRVLRMVSALHNWRCGLSKIFYGDQAMFVRRDLFTLLGGFQSTAILEDVMLSETLLKYANPEFMPQRVTTDSRKFEQMGSVSSLLRCLLILASYELGLPILGQRFFAAIR